MKLVIGGSSGFLGTELTRQALSHPAVTSVVALSRRETTDVGPGSEKLHAVVCDDFENYPDSVKSALEDADACIWTIAVTPSKLKTIPYEEVCKISRDYAVKAIKALAELRKNPKGPLRFIYISGHMSFRTRDEVPEMLRAHGLVDYSLMRGDAEEKILRYAVESNGAVESCVAKPGLIDGPSQERRIVPGVPNIHLSEAAAGLLEQVINGFEKDTLRNDDMVRIGQEALTKH
ncbi:hypothetical protein GGR53DRAFT_473857 [Hypoxylon sp. FL1150]|nr:hypothetical protein GGR53DRAFT_473857 [Hypoxylon sp. FL1150]